MKHLNDINQPKEKHGRVGDYLGSGGLFDDPKGPPAAKPLLAGTIKAREASDAAERVTKGDSKKGHHFSFLNEPKNKQESEGDSLGSGELFDAPKGPPTAKPLLAAAIKAREQADAVERAEKNDK
jgi:hypothetical protein